MAKDKGFSGADGRAGKVVGGLKVRVNRFDGAGGKGEFDHAARELVEPRDMAAGILRWAPKVDRERLEVGTKARIPKSLSRRPRQGG